MSLEFKRLDILVNNAGIAHSNVTIDKLPLPVWTRGKEESPIAHDVCFPGKP